MWVLLLNLLGEWVVLFLPDRELLEPGEPWSLSPAFSPALRAGRLAPLTVAAAGQEWYAATPSAPLLPGCGK